MVIYKIEKKSGCAYSLRQLIFRARSNRSTAAMAAMAESIDEATKPVAVTDCNEPMDTSISPRVESIVAVFSSMAVTVALMFSSLV